MPTFSNASKQKLDSCCWQLQAIFNKVIEKYDCIVLEGERGPLQQNELYEHEKSKVPYPYSKHNRKPSLAVDVAPYPVDYNDEIRAVARFYHFGGYVKRVAEEMGINIRCGLDWDGDNIFSDQSFHDLAHFELLEPKTY